MRTTDEMIIRLVSIAPLVFVTYQAVMLRRWLTSRAWTLLASGFVVFLIVVGVALVLPRTPLVARLGMSLVGYSLIAVGFHALRNDLRSLRELDRGKE